MEENIKVLCCGECPYFETHYEEYDRILGRVISKGKCALGRNNFKDEPLFETCVPCIQFDAFGT